MELSIWQMLFDEIIPHLRPDAAINDGPVWLASLKFGRAHEMWQAIKSLLGRFYTPFSDDVGKIALITVVSLEE